MNKPRPLTIPHEPDFSPADVAVILQCNQRSVHYWLQTGKLQGRRTFRFKPRIDRTELIRFCQDYLHCQITA